MTVHRPASGASRGRRGPHGQARQTNGRIVVLASSAPQWRDIVLTILRRRLADDRKIHFPVVAREAARGATQSEGVLALTRRQFRAFEADAAFALIWSDHGMRTGLPRSAVQGLAEGMTLVIPGPAALAIDAHRLSACVSIVAVGAELDKARSSLSPRACLQRLVSPAVRARLERREPGVDPQIEIAVDANIGTSIGRLTTIIAAMGSLGGKTSVPVPTSDSLRSGGSSKCLNHDEH